MMSCNGKVDHDDTVAFPSYHISQRASSFFLLTFFAVVVNAFEGEPGAKFEYNTNQSRRIQHCQAYSQKYCSKL